ncbi:MAG: lysophospholipase L1-like esterase [Candidatus Paceibacteria bacterium]|jgi:lysophospholipase L1-like esterase
MSRFSQRFFALFGTLATLIALLETVPRFVEIPGLELEELNPLIRQLRLARIEGHPYLAYAPKKDFVSPEESRQKITHNSLGFRGPEISEQKPPGVFRIMCLGGSSTYGHGPTSNERTWPYRLQKRLSMARPDLSIEVINGGCQGYTSFESLTNYAFRGIPLEPDMIIVYHAINDMRGALYEDIKTDNTHRRAVFKRYHETWLDKSWTYLTLRAYLTDYTDSQKDLGNWVIADYHERKGKDKFKWTSDRGFDNFERNLNSIITLARNNGAAVVLGTQAIKEATLDSAKSKPEQMRGFHNTNRIVRKLANNRKSVLCDLGPKLTEEGLERVAKKEKPELFTNDVHVTNLGADRIAEEFATAILSSAKLPPLK